MLFLLLLAKFINRNCKFLLEKFHRSQHSRIQKVHLGEYVKRVVLEWSTTEAKPAFRSQQACRFCYFARRVFNCLAFIQYYIVKLGLYKRLYITSQRAIGGDNNIGLWM